MSAEIVNLRRARKAKSRAEKEATAAANRVRFGRTKAERMEQSAQRDLSERRLEGARREPAKGDSIVQLGRPEPVGGAAGRRTGAEVSPEAGHGQPHTDAAGSPAFSPAASQTGDGGDGGAS